MSELTPQRRAQRDACLGLLHDNDVRLSDSERKMLMRIEGASYVKPGDLKDLAALWKRVFQRSDSP